MKAFACTGSTPYCLPLSFRWISLALSALFFRFAHAVAKSLHFVSALAPVLGIMVAILQHIMLLGTP